MASKLKAKLPKAQPKAKAVSKPSVAAALPGEDVHAAEEKMINDIGLFRTKQSQVTVESLLRDKQKARATGVPAPVTSGSLGHKAGSRSSDSSNDPGQFGLLSAMTQRLTSLERVSAQQAQLLRERDHTVAQLTLRNKSLESELQTYSTDATTAGETADLLYHLRLENERLKRQTHEMETFLNDYGLVWVGYRADADPEPDTEGEAPEVEPAKPVGAGAGAEAETPAAGEEKEIYFDMKKMLASIRDLNTLAGEGHMKIVAERGVTKFKPPEAVPLAFYKNGIFFKNGPLRPYSMPECQAFVKDMIEGYFPYELKEAYPDGVVFAVTDRSTESYDKDKVPLPTFQAFAGAGNRLGGSASASSLAPAPAPVPSSSLNAGSDAHNPAQRGGATAGPVSSGPDAALSAAQFLNRLPTSVIANGKVIEIRSDIAKLIKKQDRITPAQASSNIVLVDTPTLQLLQRSGPAPGADGAGSGSERPQTPMDITTLRVTLDDGTPPLLIKLRFHDTVGQLRDFITRNRRPAAAGSSPGPFEIRTNFPRRVYDDDSQSLQQAGLTPNANLVVRTVTVAA